MSKDNTGDTDSLRELDQLFEDWEFDVTGEPPHWEKTPERQAIDKKYRDKLDRIITQEKTAAVLSMHDSIMRHELPLGTESDLAFNYARIHRWIDAQAALHNHALTNQEKTMGNIQGFKTNLVRMMRKRTMWGIKYLLIREADFDMVYRNWSAKDRAHMGAKGKHDDKNCWCVAQSPPNHKNGD